MAVRDYFFLSGGKVKRKAAEFAWHPGYALSQQQQSIEELHAAIQANGLTPLEVSTKSTSLLGRKLSAFCLRLGGVPLECLFQGSKVFASGGPYTDLFRVSPKVAKRDARIRSGEPLISFRYEEEDWPLTPKSAFYDWLYYQVVRKTLTMEELEALAQYDAFTDLLFQSNRSINTQARSAALVVLCYRLNGGLPDMSKAGFLDLHKELVEN